MDYSEWYVKECNRFVDDHAFVCRDCLYVELCDNGDVFVHYENKSSPMFFPKAVKPFNDEAVK